MAKNQITIAICLDRKQWEVLRDYSHVVALSKSSRPSVSGVIRVLIDRHMDEMKRIIQLAATLKAAE